MTEWHKSHFSDESSQKSFDVSSYLGFRILVCRNSHDALPQEAQLRSCAEDPQQPIGSSKFYGRPIPKAIFRAMGLRPKFATIEDSGSEREKCEFYTL